MLQQQHDARIQLCIVIILKYFKVFFVQQLKDIGGQPFSVGAERVLAVHVLFKFQHFEQNTVWCGIGCSGISSSCGPVEPAFVVVLFPQQWIGEDAVGFLDLTEKDSRPWVIWIFIGMVAHRQFPVGAFDILNAGLWWNPQCVVIIFYRQKNGFKI